ncbi:MAG: hypothetical protein MJ252_22875, partial [archaeon]|nr:hypothetical protein [archaeon]
FICIFTQGTQINYVQCITSDLSNCAKDESAFKLLYENSAEYNTNSTSNIKIKYADKIFLIAYFDYYNSKVYLYTAEYESGELTITSNYTLSKSQGYYSDIFIISSKLFMVFTNSGSYSYFSFYNDTFYCYDATSHNYHSRSSSDLSLGGRITYNEKCGNFSFVYPLYNDEEALFYKEFFLPTCTDLDLGSLKNKTLVFDMSERIQPRSSYAGAFTFMGAAIRNSTVAEFNASMLNDAGQKFTGGSSTFVKKLTVKPNCPGLYEFNFIGYVKMSNNVSTTLYIPTELCTISFTYTGVCKEDIIKPNVTLEEDILEGTTSLSNMLDNIEDIKKYMMGNYDDEVVQMGAESLNLFLYMSDIDKDKLKESEIPDIDLEACINLLKEEVTEGDDVFVFVYDSESEFGGQSKVLYEFYSSQYEKLDASVCNTLTINEKKTLYLSDLKIDAETLNKMTNGGINPFDESHPAFTNPCYVLEINKKDSVLADRQSDLLQGNPCDAGCKADVKEVGNGTVEVNCACDFNEQKSLDPMDFLGFDDMTDISNIGASINTVVFSCYVNIGKWDRFRMNYSFYMSFALTVAEIVFAVYYYRTYLDQIKITMYDIRVKEMKKEKHINTNKIETTMHQYIESGRLNSNFDEMSNEFDTVKFSTVFKNQIHDKLDFFLFYPLKSNKFRPLSIRIMLFCFTIFSHLFINCIMCTEKYISQKFHSPLKYSVIDILSNFINSTLVLQVFLTFVSYTKQLFVLHPQQFEKFFYRDGKMKDDFGLYIGYKSIKIQIIVGYIVVFGLSAFYLYYILCFGNTYHYTEADCIILTLISVAIRNVLIFILCLIFSGLIYLGIIWQN